MRRYTLDGMAEATGWDRDHLRVLAQMGEEKGGINLGEACQKDSSGAVTGFVLEEDEAAKVDPERTFAESSSADRSETSPERENESAGPSAFVEHEDGTTEEVEVFVQHEKQKDAQERSGPPARQNESGKPAKQEDVIFGLSERQLVATGIASALGIVALVAYNAGREEGRLEGAARRMVDGGELFRRLSQTDAGRMLLVERGLVESGAVTEVGREFASRTYTEEGVVKWLRRSEPGKTALRQLHR